MNTPTPCRILGSDGTLTAWLPETRDSKALWVWQGALDANAIASLMRSMLRDATISCVAADAPHTLAIQRMWFDAERGNVLLAFAGPPEVGTLTS